MKRNGGNISVEEIDKKDGQPTGAFRQEPGFQMTHFQQTQKKYFLFYI